MRKSVFPQRKNGPRQISSDQEGHDGAEVYVAIKDGVVGELLEYALDPGAEVSRVDGRAGPRARHLSTMKVSKAMEIPTRSNWKGTSS